MYAFFCALCYCWPILIKTGICRKIALNLSIMRFYENRPAVRLLLDAGGQTDTTRSVGAFCASLRLACALNYDEKHKWWGLGSSGFGHRVLCVATGVYDEQGWWGYVEVGAAWRRNDYAVTSLRTRMSQCRVESYIECCLCCFSAWRMHSGKLWPKCRTWTLQTMGKEMALSAYSFHLNVEVLLSPIPYPPHSLWYPEMFALSECSHVSHVCPSDK